MVGWVDLTSAQVARQLAALRTGYAGQRLVGVRHDVSAEPDPAWLLRSDVRRGLDAVADAGLAFDLEVSPRELAAAARVAAAHPDLRFVLDHLGKPPVAAGGSVLWRRGFAGLAALGNVWCKLSGLVTEADWARWTDADLAPVLGRGGGAVRPGPAAVRLRLAGLHAGRQLRAGAGRRAPQPAPTGPGKDLLAERQCGVPA